MRRLAIDLSTFKRAGARRVRTADALVRDIAPMLNEDGSFRLPMIAGGATQFNTGIANTTAFAATPGTILFPALVPAWELPLTVAIGGINPILNTAAANAVTFCFNSGALIAPGSAATGSTVYPVQATYPTGAATQTGWSCAAAVPAGGLNVNNYLTGIGGAAAVANNQCYFGLLGLS